MQYIPAVELQKWSDLKIFSSSFKFLETLEPLCLSFHFSSKIYCIVKIFLVIDYNLESEVFEKFGKFGAKCLCKSPC